MTRGYWINEHIKESLEYLIVVKPNDMESEFLFKVLRVMDVGCLKQVNSLEFLIVRYNHMKVSFLENELTRNLANSPSYKPEVFTDT